MIGIFFPCASPFPSKSGARKRYHNYGVHIIPYYFLYCLFVFTYSGKSGLVGEKIHLRQPLDYRVERRVKGEKVQEHHTNKDEWLKRKEKEEEEFQRLLEMYTFSNALSQSVKLAIWEASLSKFVISIISVTDVMPLLLVFFFFVFFFFTLTLR